MKPKTDIDIMEEIDVWKRIKNQYNEQCHAEFDAIIKKLNRELTEYLAKDEDYDKRADDSDLIEETK